MTKPTGLDSLEQVAGNGLLHRRLFLHGGAARARRRDAADGGRAAPPDVPPWMKTPGAPMRAYGERSPHEAQRAARRRTRRRARRARAARARRSSRSKASSRRARCTSSAITTACRTSIPRSIRLLIHGLVERPLMFSMDALSRYPMVSRIQFLECSGNSAGNNNAEAAAANGRRHARPRVVQRLDRRAARGSARRGRRQARRAVAARRRRRRGGDEPQRADGEGAWTTRSSRSIRTASGCVPSRATRCGCSCPATKAT